MFYVNIQYPIGLRPSEIKTRVGWVVKLTFHSYQSLILVSAAGLPSYR